MANDLWKMTIDITTDAYEDIVTFYDNVMLAHPNTFGITDATDAINEVYDGIINRINEVFGNEREPLLKTINDGNTIELSVDKRGKRIWYFTLRLEKENDLAIVENAWHFSNASNRAFRRGTSNPIAPISDDDRTAQERNRINEFIQKTITETIRTFLRRECI